LLQLRQQWTYGASDETSQGQYKDERMQFCLMQECTWKVIECPLCQSTGLLVGLEQIDSAYCYDCLLLERIRKKQEKQKESRSLGSGKASVKGISKENRKWP